MEYIVEFSNMIGDGLAGREYSVFESSSPIPSPNIGDCIYIPEVCGKAMIFEVKERLFIYTPDSNGNNTRLHIQCMCQPTERIKG